MDRIAEIKRLYYDATPATVERAMARAIALLKEMPTEEERERASVFMDGLSQMRSEWALAKKRGAAQPADARPPKSGQRG